MITLPKVGPKQARNESNVARESQKKEQCIDNVLTKVPPLASKVPPPTIIRIDVDVTNPINMYQLFRLGMPGGSLESSFGNQAGID
jgi:hypothetical protein